MTLLSSHHNQICITRPFRYYIYHLKTPSAKSQIQATYLCEAPVLTTAYVQVGVWIIFVKREEAAVITLSELMEPRFM